MLGSIGKHGTVLLVLFTSISQSLHIINPETCSIPYIVPLTFQRACDRSDEFYRDDINVATALDTDTLISFIVPPNNISSANLRSQPSIWTHEPFCLESFEAQNGFCVYTDAKFARGRGISFVATPYTIPDVLAAAVFKYHNESEVEALLEGENRYTRIPVTGGKRYEMIANATFQWGDLVQSLSPIVVIQDPLVCDPRF
jgi:hypothetical protein